MKQAPIIDGPHAGQVIDLSPTAPYPREVRLPMPTKPRPLWARLTRTERVPDDAVYLLCYDTEAGAVYVYAYSITY